MSEKKNAVPQRETEATLISDGVYEIALPPIGFMSYLVIGAERAAVIDTGIGVGGLRAAVEQITEKPVFVINTHGHPDHAGGNAEFPETYICPADYDVFDKMASLEFRREDIRGMPGGAAFIGALLPTAPRPAPLADGQTFDLGGRTLTVLFTPGHTHGSLCVYDDKTRFLFTGDNAVKRATTLIEWNSATVAELAASLERMAALGPAKLLSGHRPNISGPELIDTYLALTRRVLAGEEGEKVSVRGTEAYALTEDGVELDHTGDML